MSLSEGLLAHPCCAVSKTSLILNTNSGRLSYQMCAPVPKANEFV